MNQIMIHIENVLIIVYEIKKPVSKKKGIISL